MDEAEHLPSSYPFREACEQKVFETQENVDDEDIEHIIGIELPNCWPDGRFAPQMIVKTG